MLPHYDRNQLTPYYRELVENKELVKNPEFRELSPIGVRNVAGPMWYGYPASYVGASFYAGLSTATNTNNQPAADTAAGNVVADAGFGDAGSGDSGSGGM